jgi:transposase-like protein
MSKRIYSTDQIKALGDNPNVAKCSNKSITFSKEFKIKAVKAYYQGGQSPNMIFKEAGFDLNVIGRYTPKFRLRDWKKIYKAKGEKGLATESRGKNGGRRSKDKQSTDMEYLQAKIAYLEAENNFLKNLKTKNKT